MGGYALIIAGASAIHDRDRGFRQLPRVLDLISMGTESAAARGVDVVRVERIALVSASMSTGAAVALGGPVLFVGIIVPHIVRTSSSAPTTVLSQLSSSGASFLARRSLRPPI